MLEKGRCGSLLGLVLVALGTTSQRIQGYLEWKRVRWGNIDANDPLAE
jgi:hypothetical protein